MAYQEITIPLANRQLHAWFVPAAHARAAVLLFHGQNDALSSLVAAIQRLHQQQLSVMVFNYSGHGASTGQPTIEGVRADSAAAYACFQTHVPSGPRFVLGYSLGAAILLDALCHHAWDVTGVILASPFASIRAVAVTDGLPPWLAWIVPDVYNNVCAIVAIPQPVLIVHSETDGTFPLGMAHQIQANARMAELVVVPSPMHAEVLASPTTIGDRADAYWQALFQFIAKQTASR
jgi:pimeloyl-ACP methyl ester carboxylesterase